jgi:MFS transporter, DHA2 family, glioxin efflux transporter
MVSSAALKWQTLDPINQCAITAISGLISSVAIGKVGYYQPFLWVGAFLATVGSGMIYTLQISSPAAHYIGYQVIAGIGIGAALQVPLIVAQGISSRADMAVAVSSILCKFSTDLVR